MSSKKTKVYVVATVKELRHALAQKGKRRITFGRFDPEAVCELGYVLYVKDHEDLVLENGDVEIDATESSLPIMIYGANFVIKKAKNVVLRNLQLRLGATGWKSKGKKVKGKDRVERESLLIEKSKNVLISHCSISWGTDETVSIVDSKKVTLEWSMISEPLNEPRDSKGELLHSNGHEHGYGCLIRGSKDVLVHHCLFAHCLRRSPSLSPDGKQQSKVQVGNCLMYDYREHGSRFNEGDAKQNYKDRVYYNLINNCYRPLSRKHGHDIALEPPLKEKLCLYHRGNLRDRGDDEMVEADLFIEKKKKNKGKVRVKDKYLLKLGYTDWDPVEKSVDLIIEKVGAIAPRRSLIDLRIIEQVTKRKGGLIDHENETPEYRFLKGIIE